jgi:hypothetical protein
MTDRAELTREQFEAWVAKYGYTEFSRWPESDALVPGEYLDPMIEVRWQGWQAAYALGHAAATQAQAERIAALESELRRCNAVMDDEEHEAMTRLAALEAKLAAAEADAKVAASHSICGCGLCTRLAAAEQTADCGGK